MRTMNLKETFDLYGRLTAAVGRCSLTLSNPN